jgi:hypothetical protein
MRWKQILHSTIVDSRLTTLTRDRSQYFLEEEKKLHGLSPRAKYTDRATAACRRSDGNFCG